MLRTFNERYKAVVANVGEQRIGKELIPFDIDKAKAGVEVATREGRKVRILCYDKPTLVDEMTSAHEILALMARTYNLEGKVCEGYQSDYDLMLRPKLVEKYYEVYYDKKTKEIKTSQMFNTKTEMFFNRFDLDNEEFRNNTEIIETRRIKYYE